MPGFAIVGDSGKPIPTITTPIYTYTWNVSQLVGEGVGEIYLKECTPPQQSFEVDEYVSPSTKYKYASKIIWNDVSLVFYDTVGLLRKLTRLADSVGDTTRGIRPAAEYKRSSIINLYSMDNKLDTTWILEGSWIKSINPTSLTYGNSDIHSVTVTLSYDWAL